MQLSRLNVTAIALLTICVEVAMAKGGLEDDISTQQSWIGGWRDRRQNEDVNIETKNMRLNRLAAFAASAVQIFLSPVATSGTSFLNTNQLLSGVEDPEWYRANAPLIDVPNSQISQVYYYRLGTYKEHYFYTGPQFGYISTEFLLAAGVGYAAPYGGIVAAAGHHINEGRWLRDQTPGKNIINFWLGAPGQAAKPQNFNDGPDASTWATEYSFWAASSVYAHYQATGDQGFAVGLLDNLVQQYRQWDNQFNETLGLYWIAPVWEASEYTAATYYLSNGDDNAAYHGGYGYTSQMNAYQYGDATAIAALATLAGNDSLATEYTNRASALQKNLIKYVWDSEEGFFKELPRDNNPNLTLVPMREAAGFTPWFSSMQLPINYSIGFKELQDPEGFSSSYGPTTTEQRSSWFFHDTLDGCCRWDAPEWPFITAMILTGTANLLNDYPAQNYITATDYYNMIVTYAASQYKDGKPYVAEAHWHNESVWIYDSYDHSEDYNHSTFIDNIISGLLGLRAQSNNTLVVNPLTPSSWNYWGIENTPYHGHNVTVLWDKTGSHYNQGQGLRVWVDGQPAGNRDTIGRLTVSVGSAIVQPLDDWVNIAANPLSFSSGPQANASYISSNSQQAPEMAIDGNIWRVGIPENTSWTSSGSTHTSDWISVDLRRPQAISNVGLYFYDNGTNVRLPTAYNVQYIPYTSSGNNSSNGTANSTNWVNIPNQTRTGQFSVNSLVNVTFPQIVTQHVRVNAPNKGNGVGWGLSELQIWTPPIFQISNENSGRIMAVTTGSKDLVVQEGSPNGTNASYSYRWQFIPDAGAWSYIQLLDEGTYLGVAGGSTADSVQLQVFDFDASREDLLWRVEFENDGEFFIRNKKSFLVAGVQNEGKQDGDMVVQYQDTNTPDHYWSLLTDIPASS